MTRRRPRGRLNELASTSEVPEKMFFKVIALRAANLKTIRSTRKPLDSLDIVVSFHNADAGDGMDEICLHGFPFCEGGDGNGSVCALSLARLDCPALLGIARWKRRNVCRYVLPNCRSLDIDNLLQAFFQQEALEGKLGKLTESSHADASALISHLELQGWAQQVGDGWQLSKKAVRELQVVHVLEDPLPILDSVPQQISALSLLTKIEANGWKFKKMVRGGVPPYALGGPKLFYSSSNSISIDYLKCLDGFSELTVEQLHHGKRIGYYQKLLAGDVRGALAMLDVNKRARPRALEDASGGDPGSVQLLADEGMCWQDSVDALRNEPEPADEVEAQPAPNELESDARLERIGELEREGADANGQGEAAVECDGSALQSGPEAEFPDVAMEAGDPVAVERRLQPETLTAWGEGPQKFRITWRKPAKDCKFGAWQGICPYHKKSLKTKCTKALTLRSSDMEENTLCLRMVQHWLVSGPSFTRAWEHACFNPRVEETPPYETLLAQSESMPVASDVLEDEALDKREVLGGESVGPQEAAASSTVAAPKRKAAGKSKGKAKAAASRKRSRSPSVHQESEADVDVSVSDLTSPASPSSSSSSSGSSGSSGSD